KIVHDITQMEQKRGAVGRTRRVEVLGEMIRDADLVSVLADVRGAGVAGDVKDHLARSLKALHDRRSVGAERRLQRVQIAGRASGLGEGDDVLGQKVLDLFVQPLVRRVRNLQHRRVGTGNTLGEDGPPNEKLGQGATSSSWHDALRDSFRMW